jgi:RNA polymerase-binding transcription factor DksA
MNSLNDDSLRAARTYLLARDAELRDRLQRVREDLGRQREPLSRDAPDAAIQLENDEVLRAVEEAARSELAHIEAALERIETGRFASCESCGEQIEPERLAVVPYATECSACVRRD